MLQRERKQSIVPCASGGQDLTKGFWCNRKDPGYGLGAA